VHICCCQHLDVRIRMLRHGRPFDCWSRGRNSDALGKEIHCDLDGVAPDRSAPRRAWLQMSREAKNLFICPGIELDIEDPPWALGFKPEIGISVAFAGVGGPLRGGTGLLKSEVPDPSRS